MVPARNPYTGYVRGAAVAAVVSLAALAYAVMTRSEHMLYYVWTLPTAVVCVISAPLFWMFGKSVQRQIAAAMEGEHLAHWTYGEAERRDFARADFRRATRDALLKALKTAGGMVVAAVVILWVDGSLRSPFAPWFITGLPIGSGLLVFVAVWVQAADTYRDRLRGPGEIFINYGGMIENGKLSYWNNAYATLTDVRLEPGTPSLLCFKVEVKQGMDWQLRVAVPSGKDADAHKIVKQLGKRPEPAKHHKTT